MSFKTAVCFIQYLSLLLVLRSYGVIITYRCQLQGPGRLVDYLDPLRL